MRRDRGFVQVRDQRFGTVRKPAQSTDLARVAGGDRPVFEPYYFFYYNNEWNDLDISFLL